MPVNDVYRVALQYSVNGEKCANVLHWRQTSVDGGANVVAELASAVIGSVIPNFIAAMSNDAHMDAVTAHKIDPVIGGSIVVPDTTVGGLVNDTLPANSVVCISLYSDHLTGRGRGRMYMSGVADQYQKYGRLTNSGPGVYITFGNTLLTPLVGGSGTGFNVGVWSTTGAVFYDYTYYLIRSRIITLRSRRMANP